MCIVYTCRIPWGWLAGFRAALLTVHHKDAGAVPFMYVQFAAKHVSLYSWQGMAYKKTIIIITVQLVFTECMQLTFKVCEWTPGWLWQAGCTHYMWR